MVIALLGAQRACNCLPNLFTSKLSITKYLIKRDNSVQSETYPNAKEYFADFIKDCGRVGRSTAARSHFLN